MTWSLPLIMLVLTAPAPTTHGTSSAPVTKLPVRDSTEREDAIDRLNHDIDKIERAIVETKQIIRISLDAPYLPDLYFHLAELYVERSRFEHTRGLEQQGDGEQMLSSERSLVVTITKKLAIETYDKVLADFPDYDRRDQIYFFKGHELRELGDYPAMSTEYETLIDRFARSKWALQARMILGDYHFDKGRVRCCREILQSHFGAEREPGAPERPLQDGLDSCQPAEVQRRSRLLQRCCAELRQFQPRKNSGRGGQNSQCAPRGADGHGLALQRDAQALPGAGATFKRPRRFATQSYLDVLRKLANRYTVKSQTGRRGAMSTARSCASAADPEENLGLRAAASSTPSTTCRRTEGPQRYQTVDDDEHAITKTWVALRDRPESVRKRADAPR